MFPGHSGEPFNFIRMKLKVLPMSRHTCYPCLRSIHFAKKSKQKKATALPLPFVFPFVQIKKWEANETRFAQTAFTSSSIFCSAQTAASERAGASIEAGCSYRLIYFGR